MVAAAALKLCPWSAFVGWLRGFETVLSASLTVPQAETNVAICSSAPREGSCP